MCLESVGQGSNISTSVPTEMLDIDTNQKQG
jgi:hypothetical protein